MRSLSAVLFFAVLALPARAADAPKAEAPKTPAPQAAAAKPAPKAALNTEDEKTIYALGLFLGRGLDGFYLTPSEMKLLKMGLEDAAYNRPPLVELQVYGPKIDPFRGARMAKKTEPEKARAKVFIEKASKEPGSVKTGSGVVYKELKAGSGAAPKATDRVKVHYTGTLTNGKVFDSSVKRGQPVEFSLDGVIPCWTEGVQKMKVGGKAKLVCPSDKAYGDRGEPRAGIPGGAALVFEIELLDIIAPPAAVSMTPEAQAPAAAPAQAAPAQAAPAQAAPAQTPPNPKDSSKP